MVHRVVESVTLAERFWAKVAVGAPDECWLWMGALKSAAEGRDYGAIKVDGRAVRAHRVAFLIHYGTDPGERLVRHSCDTPRCCNPAHLLLGTQSDNMRDAAARGRIVTSRGESSPFARLTDEAVREIRDSTATISALSRRYGVSRPVITKIRAREAWSHVV